MFELKDITITTDGITTAYPVLGSRSIAESLIEWSKGRPVGTQFSKETPWGLKLTFTACEERPSVIYQLNGKKLSAMLREMGPISIAHIFSYGIGMVMPGKRDPVDGVPGELTDVYIIFKKEDGVQVVFTWKHGDHRVDIFLGRLDIREEGFFFYTEEDIKDYMATAIKAAMEEEEKEKKEEVRTMEVGGGANTEGTEMEDGDETVCLSEDEGEE